jgi:hypothetical protein
MHGRGKIVSFNTPTVVKVAVGACGFRQASLNLVTLQRSQRICPHVCTDSKLSTEQQSAMPANVHSGSRWKKEYRLRA